MQRYILKLNIQIFFYFLLKIYAFTVWKFRVRLKITDAPYFVKIPVRLKISVRSENPYLKISVH